MVLADVQDAASVFDSEAGTLRGLIPAGGPACPDAGSGDIDAAMQAVLKSFGR